MIKVILLSLWQYFTQIMLKKTVPICFITLLNVNLHLNCLQKQKVNAELKGWCLQTWCGRANAWVTRKQQLHLLYNHLPCRENQEEEQRDMSVHSGVCLSTWFLFSFYLYLSISWNIYPYQVAHVLYVSSLFHVPVLWPVSLLGILFLLYSPEHTHFI